MKLYAVATIQYVTMATVMVHGVMSDSRSTFAMIRATTDQSEEEEIDGASQGDFCTSMLRRAKRNNLNINVEVWEARSSQPTAFQNHRPSGTDLRFGRLKFNPELNQP